MTTFTERQAQRLADRIEWRDSAAAKRQRAVQARNDAIVCGLLMGVAISAALAFAVAVGLAVLQAFN